MNFESNGQYSIRLAEPEEEKEILRLRYKIFTEELQEGSQNQYKQDFDAFDEYCDFLLLIHNKSMEIVGLYRILPFFKLGSIGYYSETEFKLNLPKENIAELGRLCIKKEHRGRGLLGLLWMGLIKYAKENKIRYFFGCGSLKPNTSWIEMCNIYWYLRAKKKIFDNAVPLLPREVKKKLLAVNKGIEIEDIEDEAIHIYHFDAPDKEWFNQICPSLIKRYLKIGTKILGRPAYDPYFKCYDFLLFIDSSNIRVKMLNICLKTQMIINKIFGGGGGKLNGKTKQ